MRSKQKLFDLFFDKLSLPAAYIANFGLLSSIATGRPTSLVIDFVSVHTRITPVVDGYVLKKAVISTNRGGNYLDQVLFKEIVNSVSMDVRTSLFEFLKFAIVQDAKAYFYCVPTEPVNESKIVQSQQAVAVPAHTLSLNGCTPPCLSALWT